MIPRIRGRTSQGEDGKFYNEITLWDFAGEKQIGEPFTFGPYETKDQGLEELKKQAQTATEGIEKNMNGGVSGKYIDMKNGGVLRPWKDHS